MIQPSSLVPSSNNPKVSIIVPIYNAGEHLRPCMETLINQTLREIEIICVLDCPTDGSDKVVEEYAAHDNRIIVIRNEHNLHIGNSRNRGLGVARGEYIGFSDHDDIRELDMYEKLYEKTIFNKCDIVFSGSLGQLLLDESFSVETLYKGLIARRLSPIIMHNMFRREFLQNNDILFVDTKHCTLEDVVFMVQTSQYLLCDNNTYAAVPRLFYHHIMHISNEVNTGDYWGLVKTTNTIDRLKSITTQYPCQVNDELAEMTVRSLYTSFRFERKRRCSLPQFMKKLQTTAVLDIFQAYPIRYNTHLTIAKNLFALFIIIAFRIMNRKS